MLPRMGQSFIYILLNNIILANTFQFNKRYSTAFNSSKAWLLIVAKHEIL